MKKTYKKQKETAGFYDIVEGYFLTNNGTGQLIAGPDV